MRCAVVLTDLMVDRYHQDQKGSVSKLPFKMKLFSLFFSFLNHRLVHGLKCLVNPPSCLKVLAASVRDVDGELVIMCECRLCQQIKEQNAGLCRGKR